VKRGGVLFFGKHPEKYFFQAVTRCVRFKGTDKVHIIDDKIYGGTVYQQYKQATEWLKDKMQVAYIMEGTGPRKEVWEIPLEVFKEAIINALSHRDYYEKGAKIMVEVYDDRVEICNPGGLLPAVANSFGTKSMSRNPLIFGLFTRMNLVEQVGSGIPRMRNLMLAASLPEPVYNKEGFFTIKFLRSPEEKNDSNRNKDTEKVTEKVTENQRLILQNISENPYITSFELSSKVGISDNKVRINIAKLKSRGILERIGADKGGYWKIIERL
jgi:ATP-dependent DNA helicase RecG